MGLGGSGSNGDHRLVEVDPFRERYVELREREGLTLSMVADRLGWTIPPSPAYPEVRPDTTRAARALGLKPYMSKRRTYIRSRVREGTARKLAEALDMDPYEAGF